MNVSNSVSGQVFEFALGGLFDKVKDTVNSVTANLRNAGMELEIQAGQELVTAIEQVRNNYKSMLKDTVDTLKGPAKIAFDNLNSMVAEFEKKEKADLTKVMKDAQQLVNSFPFSNKLPQLTTVKPRFLVIADVANASLVTFQGNFPHSAKPGFEASLIFEKEVCTLVDSSTQALTFQIPHSIFGASPKDKYSFQTGVLSVPYDDGWFMSHKVESSYRVGLGALPLLAGKGSIEFKATGTEKKVEHTLSDNRLYDGNSWYPEHWHTEYCVFRPKTGWKIDDTKQPILHSKHVHGDHNQSILSFTSTEIVVKVALYCKSGSDIGKVWIQVEFDQYIDQTKDQSRTLDFDINWKDSKLIEPQGNEVISKVVFDDYKGVHQEYASPDVGHGVLQIRSEGNGVWKMWAEAPDVLQVKSSELSVELKNKIDTVRRFSHLQQVANIPKDLTMLPISGTSVHTTPPVVQTGADSKSKETPNAALIAQTSS